MDIEFTREPFEHAIIDNLISVNDCNQLWNLANNIPEDSIDFTRGGQQQDNMYMHHNSQNIPTQHEVIDGRLHYAVTSASRLFDDYDDEFYTWSCGLTETNRNDGNFLYPHTDDPEELKKRDPKGLYVPAPLKAVFYLPNYRQHFPHYGTKLYNNNDRASFVREIDFKLARCFMWKTGPHSWHGTDFVKGLPHRRFFYTCEYLPRVIVNQTDTITGLDPVPIET
jgi:hypothetical protein